MTIKKKYNIYYIIILMSLSYENINLKPDTYFGCNFDISELGNFSEIQKLLVFGDYCDKKDMELEKRADSYGDMKDFEGIYTTKPHEEIVIKRPSLQFSTKMLKFLIYTAIPTNKKLEPLGKHLLDMYKLYLETEKTAVNIIDSSKSLKISYLKPIPREVMLIFTEIYVKAILKLFLSKKLVNHVENQNRYTEYRNFLNNRINVDDVYTKITNCITSSYISNNDNKLEIKHYANYSKTVSFLNDNNFSNGFTLPESSMFMTFHQFLYDTLVIALELNKQNFLPHDYFYIISPLTNILSVEPIAINLPINAQNIEYKADKINREVKAIVDNKYNKELETQVIELRDKLNTIGVDSTIALKLNTDIENLKSRLNSSAQIEDQNKIKQEIKELTDKLSLENEANKIKAESVEKSLTETKKQLEDQIKLENQNKQELKTTIDSLKNELRINSELNSNEKEIIAEQVSKLKTQLEAEELNDTEEKRKLQNHFDLLKNELEQTKEVLKNKGNDTFMDKYGVALVVIIAIVLVLLLLLVGYLLMNRK